MSDRLCPECHRPVHGSDGMLATLVLRARLAIRSLAGAVAS